MCFKKRNETLEKKLYDKYHVYCGHIGRVINSCETREQLINAQNWGLNLLYSIDNMENDRCNFGDGLKVYRYFEHQRNIVREMCIRKMTQFKQHNVKTEKIS